MIYYSVTKTVKYTSVIINMDHNMQKGFLHIMGCGNSFNNDFNTHK